jgi:monoamine oxidase
MPFDLGAHWLHSAPHNPLRPLAIERGVRFWEAALRDQLFWKEKRLAGNEEAACLAAIDAAFEAVSSCTDDVAAGTFAGKAGAWREAFEAAYTIKQGVAASHASSRDFAAYLWEGDDLPVVDGLGKLIAELSRGLQISCDRAVDQIDCSTAGIARVSGTWGSLEARHVVVTASTGVLQSGRIRFFPALPLAHQEALAALPMGSCNKVAIAFSPGSLANLTDTLAVPYGSGAEAVEIVAGENGSDLLVGLVHGAFGKQLAAEGKEVMRSYLLELAAKLWGSDLAKAALPETMIADWDHDPWVGGYVSAALPGKAAARGLLGKSIAGRLHFAGEATSPKFMGDLHGAWLSGEAAIRELH